MSPLTQRSSLSALFLALLHTSLEAVATKPTVVSPPLRAQRQRLHPEAVALVARSESSPKEDYIEKCVVHVKEVIARESEGDLKSMCKQSKEHPNSYEDGLKSYDACIKFAEKIAEARAREKKGEKPGYTAICEDAWAHYNFARRNFGMSAVLFALVAPRLVEALGALRL
mmetsp:Transcript_32049/g.92351  ORF Transcript_32049/g.92351 Transcript_32049/m.92351 type:complete len:170 (+) Transcript_32049:73-582(+)